MDGARLAYEVSPQGPASLKQATGFVGSPKYCASRPNKGPGTLFLEESPGGSDPPRLGPAKGVPCPKPLAPALYWPASG